MILISYQLAILEWVIAASRVHRNPPTRLLGYDTNPGRVDAGRSVRQLYEAASCSLR
jgi:hypothetical protein